MNTQKTIITDKIDDKTVRLKKGEALTYIAFIKKGWSKKRTLTFELKETESSLNFLAVFIGKEEESFPFNINIQHQVAGTKANTSVRSVLFDKSKIDFTGNLIVPKKSQKTETRLEHHSLMLSKDAKTFTTPCLEIEADDVKAGHAASAGYIDEESLFYMETRGINEKDAKTQLIKAFLKADLENLKNDQAQSYINNKIDENL